MFSKNVKTTLLCGSKILSNSFMFEVPRNLGGRIKMKHPVYRVYENFEFSKCEGRLTQIKKEGPIWGKDQQSRQHRTSYGHSFYVHFMFILRPHVHGHKMNVHRTSDLRHPLTANIWTSTRCPVLEIKVPREHAKMFGQAAIYWAEKGHRVVYITPSPLAKRPVVCHDRNNPAVATLDLMRFIYLPAYETFIEQLVKLHTYAAVPSVLLIDDLDNYFNDEAVKNVSFMHIARTCALISHSMKSCSRILKMNVYIVVGKLYGLKVAIRWRHWFDLEKSFEGHVVTKPRRSVAIAEFTVRRCAEAECRANPSGGEVKPVSVGVHGQEAECRANPGDREVKPVSVGVHGQEAECRANPGDREVKPVSVGVHGQEAECRANPGDREVKPVSVGVHGQEAECRANPGDREVKPVSVGVHGQEAECRANPGDREVKPVSVGVHGQEAECRANPGDREVKPVSVGVHGQEAECRANPGDREVKPVSVGVHGQEAECRANPGDREVKPVSVGVHGQKAECRANPGGGEVTPVSVGGNGQEAECRANPGSGEVTPVSVGGNGQDERPRLFPEVLIGSETERNSKGPYDKSTKFQKRLKGPTQSCIPSQPDCELKPSYNMVTAV
ncbi:hypothetical protein EAG_03689 [Camponotus floridanus]|uniref:Uncharacterized protein n=1 Tax=Camponotus floridanus TaxID=104421 RepID=E2AAB3_CAMFO|nr:hypothetical protein EAG_03689 [Camponotus floridanus]